VLRKALERARDAFIEVLEGYTLSDLVKPRRGCKRCCLLRLSNPFEHTPAHEGAGENRVGGCCRLGFRAEVHQ
jgi:hypothetical protein